MIDITFWPICESLRGLDLTQTLRYKVLVERKGFTFFVELDYENPPNFCTNCKIIGHYLEICKKVNIEEDANKEKEPANRRMKGAT